MSEVQKKKRRAITMGVIGLASFMGVATVGLVIGTSLKGSKTTVAHGDVAHDWAKIANDKLAAGFGFATASFTNGILSIKGDAPNADARINAFEAGKNAVLSEIDAKKLEGKSGVLAFANDITIGGMAISEIPDATATLGKNPEKEACQTAYNTLLDGRVINFNSGSAIISEDSKALLDGLANVAGKCTNYTVEVGGHTDTKGDAGANLSLSERRAQAVADYLIGKGVNSSEIQIKGYGETVPLDTANTKEADAKNRRIEFKVSEKAE